MYIKIKNCISINKKRLDSWKLLWHIFDNLLDKINMIFALFYLTEINRSYQYF